MFAMAWAAAGSSPVVRLPAGEPWLIKRALDCGAHGLLIPMSETKEQAPSAVSAGRYPDVEKYRVAFAALGRYFLPPISIRMVESV
jgi:4-hydroxy-2-oxoheptanedioate aldolase